VTQTVAVPYNPDWPRQFEVERSLLRRALAPWLVADVEHVGSTAIPGMSAKPTIDMVAGIRDLDEARAASGPMAALDYVYRDHRPEALLFCKPISDDWRRQTHHLHLTVPGSDIWHERLAFRDALRADPAAVAEYSEWKLAHADSGGERYAYTADKRPFVERVLASRGIGLKADRERLTRLLRDD
jgi:GrpB-like predicted nucleotidyltransferase (UPF0157 family)